MTNGNITLDFAFQVFNAEGKYRTYEPRIAQLPARAKMLHDLTPADVDALVDVFGRNYAVLLPFAREIEPYLTPDARMYLHQRMDSLRQQWREHSRRAVKTRWQKREALLQKVKSYVQQHRLSSARANSLERAARLLEAHLTDGKPDWDAIAQSIRGAAHNPANAYSRFADVVYVWRKILGEGDAPAPNHYFPTRYQQVLQQPHTTQHVNLRDAILDALRESSPARVWFGLGKIAPDWADKHYETIDAFLKALQEVNS